MISTTMSDNYNHKYEQFNATDFLSWLLGGDTDVIRLSINDEHYWDWVDYQVRWYTIKSSNLGTDTMNLDTNTSYEFEAVSLECPCCHEPYTRDVVLSCTDSFLLGLAYACGTEIEYRQHYHQVNPKLTPIKWRRSAQCELMELNQQTNEDEI